MTAWLLGAQGFGPVAGPGEAAEVPVAGAPRTAIDRYFTTAGQGTSLNVLANDSDPDGDRLRVMTVTTPGNGSAVLNADQTVTYRPAPGFSGVDRFSYVITDNRGGFATGVVEITVHPAPPAPPGDPFIRYSFDYGMEGMLYADDRFRGTGTGEYARGVMRDGALGVELGGIDGTLVEGISGGWQLSFTLPEARNLILEFRYSARLSGALEGNEELEVLVALDEALIGSRTDGSVAVLEVTEPGVDRETGWIPVSLDLGDVGPGFHLLDLGGFLTRKNDTVETAAVMFDDLAIYTRAPAGAIAVSPEPVVQPTTVRLTSDADDVKLRAYGDTVSGSFGDDTVNGMGGDDFLFGEAGRDLLKGARGDDTLVGGTGDDVIYGGSGSDEIWGGAGMDILIGDSGSESYADTFVFSEADIGSIDRIRDFDWREGDRLDFSRYVSGYGGGDPGGYVDLMEVNGNTIVRLDRDGGGDGFERVLVLLETTDLPAVEALIANGSLLL